MFLHRKQQINKSFGINKYQRIFYPFFFSKFSVSYSFRNILISSIFHEHLYNHYIMIKTRNSHQYAPRRTKYKKAHKGRIPVPIGMSTKGSTVVYGEFGMRLKEHGVQFTAKQLQTAEMVIKRAIKSTKGATVYTRIATNIAVCVKGNETRMGKGKGSFHHWAARVPIGRVVFEVGGGNISSKVAIEALRRAKYKLPGRWEIIKRGMPARIGLHNILPETPPKHSDIIRSI
ncbi:hypothetical protein PORY_000891 [Pneumocystis oryctolagi]|uniref:Uncharacterized protein n=1 Tax=Pneumocystis oryctolagi TaxID=42067 RepID=A0ACB7CEI1_9ASCO|nr:hypothetical protein PORY_000891 [Pneumocystis oryctolagi]